MFVLLYILFIHHKSLSMRKVRLLYTAIRFCKCFKWHFAADEIAGGVILHLELIFLVHLFLFRFQIVFSTSLRWFLKILGINFQFFKWAIWLVIQSTDVTLNPTSPVEILSAYLGADAGGLVRSFRVLHSEPFARWSAHGPVLRVGDYATICTCS